MNLASVYLLAHFYCSQFHNLYDHFYRVHYLNTSNRNIFRYLESFHPKLIRIHKYLKYFCHILERTVRRVLVHYILCAISNICVAVIKIPIMDCLKGTRLILSHDFREISVHHNRKGVATGVAPSTMLGTCLGHLFIC